MSVITPGKSCYIDDQPCDCGNYELAGRCPRDEYEHDEELISEEDIDDLYEARSLFAKEHEHD